MGIKCMCANGCDRYDTRVKHTARCKRQNEALHMGVLVNDVETRGPQGLGTYITSPSVLWL